MIGLKSYLPVLAGHLDRSPDKLYERQRKLTQAGLLVGSSGRGPGSGVRVNPPNVALMLLALLATDELADMVARVEFLASKTAVRDRCPLTGASMFSGALELTLASESLAASVQRVEVMRSSLRAHILYAGPSARAGLKLQISAFGEGDASIPTGLELTCGLSGDRLQAIAREIAQIAAGKSISDLTSSGSKDAKV
jgi:hypothetical protein